MGDIWEELANAQREEADRLDNDPLIRARKAARIRQEIARGLRDADGYLVGFDGPDDEDEEDEDEDEDED